MLFDANVPVSSPLASAGITDLLVALAEGLGTASDSKNSTLFGRPVCHSGTFGYPNVIREEIERLLENITVLAEAAALATSPASQRAGQPRRADVDLLFVEILRERDVAGTVV